MGKLVHFSFVLSAILFLVALSQVQGFNADEARRYALHSFSSYCKSDYITNWSCSFCKETNVALSSIQIFHDVGTDAFVFLGLDDTNSQIVVSFKGSKGIQTWIDDIKFAKTDRSFDGIDGCRVHSGFYDTFRSVEIGLTAALIDLRAKNPTYQTVITGHSLGGALASLYSMSLAYEHNITDFKMYTFGAPRFGNQECVDAFKSKLDGALERVVHDHDIVPHLPPESFGFKHLPQEIWEVGSKYTECDDSGEDSKCSDSLWVPVVITDHWYYMGVEIVFGITLGCFV